MIAEEVILPDCMERIGDITIMDADRRVVAQMTAGEFRLLHPVTTCSRHKRLCCLMCGDRMHAFKPGRENELLPWRGR